MIDEPPQYKGQQPAPSNSGSQQPKSKFFNVGGKQLIGQLGADGNYYVNRCLNSTLFRSQARGVGIVHSVSNLSAVDAPASAEARDCSREAFSAVSDFTFSSATFLAASACSARSL